MIFHEVQLERIKLEPGEILSVKVTSDEVDEDSIAQLREQLTRLFPANQVMLFAMPLGSDIQFQAIQQSQEPCRSTITGACEDCDCGKQKGWQDPGIDDLIAELEKNNKGDSNGK